MSRFALLFLVAFFALFATIVSAEVYFKESFENMDKWVQSKQKDNYGKFELSAGSWYGDAKADQGLRATQDARHYAVAAPFDTPIESTKDKTFVMQYSLKWGEDGIDCGGGYLKAMPKPAGGLEKFDGDSQYGLMFGPDVCGATRRVHMIFNYKGKNLLWKKTLPCETDKFTHVYTAIVKPDNTYEVLIDGERKDGGSLYDDWDFLAPKEIDDPSDKKPEDWVDEKEIDDPTDTKPEDWDSEPKFIADPQAKKPEDWDEDEDGAWEAPKIQNPKWQGDWKAKRIPNPAYKGEWKQKRIANPDFVDDKEIYVQKNLEAAGIEIWTVKSKQIFDNILVTDDESVAKQERDAVLERAKAEKDMYNKIEEEKRAKEEAERKKRDEEEAKRKAEEDAKKAEDEAKKESEELKEAAESAEAPTDDSKHDEL